MDVKTGAYGDGSRMQVRPNALNHGLVKTGPTDSSAAAVPTFDNCC
jgi:hypothetical protein